MSPPSPSLRLLLAGVAARSSQSQSAQLKREGGYGERKGEKEEREKNVGGHCCRPFTTRSVPRAFLLFFFLFSCSVRMLSLLDTVIDEESNSFNKQPRRREPKPKKTKESRAPSVQKREEAKKKKSGEGRIAGVES